MSVRSVHLTFPLTFPMPAGFPSGHCSTSQVSRPEISPAGEKTDGSGGAKHTLLPPHSYYLGKPEGFGTCAGLVCFGLKTQLLLPKSSGKLHNFVGVLQTKELEP